MTPVVERRRTTIVGIPVRTGECIQEGEPNMTSPMFCEYVNSSLLPSNHIPPHFPRSISLRTAIRWLHKLDFKSMGHNGIFIDGHERVDVVKYRGEFLQEMHSLCRLTSLDLPAMMSLLQNPILDCRRRLQHHQSVTTRSWS